MSLQQQSFYEEFEKANGERKNLTISRSTYLQYAKWLGWISAEEEEKIPNGETLMYKNIKIICEREPR